MTICPDTHPSGQKIRFSYETRVGGVLTDPAALRFKFRAPEDTTTTTYTYLTDAELVRESTGKFYVDLNPVEIAPGAEEGYWIGRWESETPWTAKEFNFTVKEPNV